MVLGVVLVTVANIHTHMLDTNAKLNEHQIGACHVKRL